MSTTADTRPDTAFAMLFGTGEDALDALSERLAPRLLEQSRNGLEALAKPVRETVLRQLIAQAAEFLGVVLGDVLWRGWCSYEQLREAIDETAESPNTTREVALEEHEITAEYSCVLAVELGELPAPLHEVPLRLTVTARLAGATLEVHNGRLTSAQLVGPGGIEIAAEAYQRPVAEASRSLDPMWVRQFGPGLSLPASRAPKVATAPIILR